MKLKEMSTEQIMTELHKEFSQSQLNLAQEKLTNLIKTSETIDQLVARVYEAVNVEIEENQVKVNKKINRLDTRKDNL
jgi:hypothetical protein